MDSVCEHISSITDLKKDSKYVCDECTKIGSRWVHLRTCQTCGATLCCDNSPNRHMTKHYHATAHPVVISAEPGERWFWCYKDEIFAEY
jgi:predicted ATP-dependent serine protease